MKVIEWNALKDLFEEQRNCNKSLSLLRETLELLGSRKKQLDRSCNELIKLQLISEELTTLANESAEGNITMLKCKQRAKAHRLDASDIESAFKTSAAPSPNLLRKQYPLRNRAMKHHSSSCNIQESNNADSFDSEDPDNSQPVLNIEEKRRNREFLKGALRRDERSREENNVQGQSRHESADSRAGYLQQPCSFHKNSQASPPMSQRYPPQINQLPLNNFGGPDGHINNGYSNNLYNGFPSFPPDWKQHQALMIQNTSKLTKISIENFTSDTMKWHQWFSFFKATIHNNSGLSHAQKMTYLQNSVTHKARDSICGHSYNGDYYHEAITELTRKNGKSQHIVAAYLDQLEKWPKARLDEPNTFVSFSSFLRRLLQTIRLHNFEADLKSSAFLKMARDKLNATRTIRWNQHTRSQALLQHNLTHFADWIAFYSEACEDISPQRNQRTREQFF